MQSGCIIIVVLTTVVLFQHHRRSKAVSRTRVVGGPCHAVREVGKTGTVVTVVTVETGPTGLTGEEAAAAAGGTKIKVAAILSDNFFFLVVPWLVPLRRFKLRLRPVLE